MEKVKGFLKKMQKKYIYLVLITGFICIYLVLIIAVFICILPAMVYGVGKYIVKQIIKLFK